MRTRTAAFFVVLALFPFGTPARAQSFVNFETPHVSPIAMSPDGTTLAVCNTPDNRIEFFDLTGDGPVADGSVEVGMDPVSCRFRTDGELWVANQISDSVSVVDVAGRYVRRTLFAFSDVMDDLFLDEPADIVFAGTPEKAFVTFSQSNTVVVWDPADLDAAPTLIPINGEDPRAMAVSPDGAYVYVAIFESGNRTTLLGGGAEDLSVINFPPNDALNDGANPYGGVNPPPNDGAVFDPPKNPANGTAPRVGLIVKQDDNGVWRDDNGEDWSDWISGPKASMSGRTTGWTLIDNDVARINASTMAVEYAENLMNICMAIGVNPATGIVTVVGTEATNEIRFEPVINGKFIRVRLGFVDMSLDTSFVDLNGGHLDYMAPSIAPAERMKSIGDPRGIVWNTAGTRGYITGMGSNNVIVVDASGVRVDAMPMPVPEGPTGLVLDEARQKLYVVSKFASELTILDLANPGASQLALYDPSPEAIKVGRRQLYDTHRNSGLGQISCASCHVDARMDRLSWDLGDPAAPIKFLDDDDALQNLGMNVFGLNFGFQDWHPMKGPMSTQTMQDIIGHEPHHWRGDRDGLEEFAAAFSGLQGGPPPTAQDMQEFEDFLATVTFPPNPFRELDNTLRSDLPVGDLGHVKSGRFGNGGDPLPDGDANRALGMYRDFENPLDQATFSCVLCHVLPTGGGSNTTFNGDFINPVFTEIPAGPDGEVHSTLVAVDGVTNRSMKVAQLRNTYEKAGANFHHTESRAGFGVLHDGSVDSIERFVSLTAFDMTSDQDVADMTSLILQFSGSDFGPPSSNLEPPGTPSKDTHAAVGKQVTLTEPEQAKGVEGDGLVYQQLLAIATASPRVDLVLHQPGEDGVNRGFVPFSSKGQVFLQADASGEIVGLADIEATISASRPLTATAIPAGAGPRMGIDRDLDGLYDYDEYVAGSSSETGDTDGDGLGDAAEVLLYGTRPDEADTDGDGMTDKEEIDGGTDPLVDESRDPADVNGDDFVNAVDVQLVINAALGLGNGGADPDVNRDDEVNAVDVQLVINAALGLK